MKYADLLAALLMPLTIAIIVGFVLFSLLTQSPLAAR